MSDFAREASAVNGKEFDGTNAENLTKAFNQIYSSITSSAKIKVFSITDTLSKWVDRSISLAWLPVPTLRGM